jgi:hypothetical protein
MPFPKLDMELSMMVTDLFLEGFDGVSIVLGNSFSQFSPGRRDPSLYKAIWACQ